MANSGAVQEDQQFILRFADPALGDRVRRALREEEGENISNLQIFFPDSEKEGVLEIDGKRYTIDLLNLPTVVESYKTYDDTNLVKTGDIGQILLVGGKIKTGQVESNDGITPPMRNARHRHFRKLPNFETQMISKVEADLWNILNGGAPLGYEYHDFEEEWVVDSKTNVGSWQIVKPPAPVLAPAAPGVGEPVVAETTGTAGTSTATEAGPASLGVVGSLPDGTPTATTGGKPGPKPKVKKPRKSAASTAAAAAAATEGS